MLRLARIASMTPLLLMALASASAADSPTTGGVGTQSGTVANPATGSDRTQSGTVANPATVGERAQSETPARQAYGAPKNPAVGDPVDADVSKPLSLDRAIRIGLQEQNSIALSKTQVDSAKARLTQAKSNWYPRVTPSYQYQSNFASGRAGSGTSQSHSTSITARQTLYDFGKRGANVSLSRHSLSAAEYGVGDQRQDVILAVTEAWYALLRNRDLMRVQVEAVRRATTNLEAIRAEIEAETSAKSDALQFEADLATAEVNRLQAQNTLDISEARLKNAMGIVYSGPLAIPDAPAAMPAPSEAMSLEKLVDQAYGTRLDVKRQAERIRVQQDSLRVTRLNNGVSITADLAETYRLEPHSGEDRQFNLSISYPLFNGGASKAAIQESQAQLEAEKRNLDALQQNVRFNLEQSFLSREQSRRRYAAAGTALEAARKNYEVAVEKRKNDLFNVLDVINVESQLVNAEVNAVQAIYDFFVADAQLTRDLGANDPDYAPLLPDAGAFRITTPAPAGRP